MLQLLLFLGVIQVSVGSIWTERCRLHHPWPPDNDWFDRSLDVFSSPLSDPFNHPLFDTHWSDDLLFPSLVAGARSDIKVAERPPQDLSDTLRFYVDITGFSPRDLTLKTQGQNLLITGLKTSCDFTSCYERRYCLKKKLPADVKIDTLMARVMPGRETLQIEAQRKKGVEGDEHKNIPLATVKGKQTEQAKQWQDSKFTEKIMRKNAVEEEDETTIEVVPDE